MFHEFGKYQVVAMYAAVIKIAGLHKMFLQPETTPLPITWLKSIYIPNEEEEDSHHRRIEFVFCIANGTDKVVRAEVEMAKVEGTRIWVPSLLRLSTPDGKWSDTQRVGLIRGNLESRKVEGVYPYGSMLDFVVGIE